MSGHSVLHSNSHSLKQVPLAMGLSKMGHIEKTAIKKRLGRLLEKAVKKSRRHYTPTDILAHELGHLKAFSKGPSGLVKPRLFLYGTGPAIGTAASFAVPATGKFSGKRALIGCWLCTKISGRSCGNLLWPQGDEEA